MEHLTQNHRLAKAGSNILRTSLPTHLLKEGHLLQATQDHIQTAFEYLQGIHYLTGQPVPLLNHPHSKKVFPDVQRESPAFQLVPIASCSVTANHWKEPGSILFAPSFRYLYTLIRSTLSLLFYRLNSPKCPSLSSYERCCSPFITFVAIC